MNGFRPSAIRCIPDGDPRAAALLSRMQPPPGARRLIEAMQAMTGIAPNIDCALLVLEQRLRLPTGAAFAIFAAGRTVGWIAHALEQWRDGTLIRPRAVYPGRTTDGGQDRARSPASVRGVQH